MVQFKSKNLIEKLVCAEHKWHGIFSVVAQLTESNRNGSGGTAEISFSCCQPLQFRPFLCRSSITTNIIKIKQNPTLKNPTQFSVLNTDQKKQMMKAPLKEHQSPSLVRKILPFAIYAVVSLALFRFFFTPSPLSPSLPFPTSTPSPPAGNSPPPPPSSPPLLVKEEKIVEEIRPCDYTNGTWVATKVGPLYNGTSCGSIKDGQNCISHGKTELGYLFWRWSPSECKLPRFDPSKFLDLMRNKHIAFVGDSMARNQLESLVCMLSSAYPPNLVYTNGPDNKFRRWHFPSHNVNVSVYWSPFLVKGVEKSNPGPNHNKLYFDSIDERWGSDLGWIDMVVLSIGHWYLHPAVYYEGDSVLGCHACTGMNHTEIGFFEVFRKGYRTALKAIVERKSANGGAIDVFLTTFSPSHFEGEWDKAAACPKTKPYKQGEKELEWMDAEMRKIGLEEIELAKNSVSLGGIKINALDITKLAILRPDSHPGPYMHPFPFANGVPERVQNDCLHWCLPGAIDTWNEIMLEVIKRLHPRSIRQSVH